MCTHNYEDNPNVECESESLLCRWICACMVRAVVTIYVVLLEV